MEEAIMSQAFKQNYIFWLSKLKSSTHQGYTS